MRMRRIGIGRKLALAAQITVLSLAGSHVAEALEKVRILIPVRAIDEAFSPFVVAKEKGYFESEGYDVSLLAVGGSNEAALQVSAGNAEVGAASPGEAIIGIQSGQLKIRYYYDMYYANIWSVAVLPESPIKSLADLKDKKLGVQSMGSAGTTFAKAFVKEAGLDPQKDISFLPIGLGLEVAKLVAARRLHQGHLTTGLRATLFALVTVCMAVTTIGVYGFISRAYADRVATMTQSTDHALADATERAKVAEQQVADIDRQLGGLTGNGRVERARAYVREQVKKLKLASIEAV